MAEPSPRVPSASAAWPPPARREFGAAAGGESFVVVAVGRAAFQRDTSEADMILMIDNYDSFTYNLVQYLGELGEDVRVFRNDEITVDEIGALKPTRLVLSPGPCSPAEAGVCVGAIEAFVGKLPILGVCLGHQAIGAAMGGRVVRAKIQMHGKADVVTSDGRGVYTDLPREFSVIRYHSLVIDRESLPCALDITSTSRHGEIMGIRHRELAGTATPLEGVQFHPESILTEHGHAMLKNFLEMTG